MKRIVLLGGGHAHLFVLEAFARQRPDADVLMITPDALTPYSGMMPGVIAGHYRAREACIDLRPLAARAGCRLHLDLAIGIDAAQRCVVLASGARVDYDLLSVDTGSTPRLPAVPGVGHGHPVKPIGRLEMHWRRVLAQQPSSAVVVGAGAAGVEIVMALRQRCPGMHCSLVDSNAQLLAGMAPGLRRRVGAQLRRQQIDLLTGCTLDHVGQGRVVLADGRMMNSDFTVWTTGAAAPDWLHDGALALDARGFIETAGTLQSTSHPEVFAAGDVASVRGAPRPKSGVYAVRAGPHLAANLRRALAGMALQPWQAQQRALMLLACGRQHAIAARGGWSLQGDWVWRWKDWIDRAFIARFDPLARAAQS
jgi:pyridine nucleotide-disulfide oxidoreductase family protein